MLCTLTSMHKMSPQLFWIINFFHEPSSKTLSDLWFYLSCNVTFAKHYLLKVKVTIYYTLCNIAINIKSLLFHQVWCCFKVSIKDLAPAHVFTYVYAIIQGHWLIHFQHWVLKLKWDFAWWYIIRWHLSLFSPIKLTWP